jgi:membrane associated rhomboid family serine protease
MSQPDPSDPRNPSGAPPTCYRHPDRETYIRCSRCDRPICPNCMTSAAVGFQCPECVAEGARSVRTPTTIAGGRLVSTDGLVTKIIIAINVVVFVLQQIQATLTQRFAMLGLAVDGNGHWIGVAAGQYYRLMSAAFLHENVLHIGTNMLALYFVGPPVERSLGRARYIVLYLLAALGGSVASYMWGPPNVLGVGASGAIFGVFGALLIITRRIGADISGILVLIGINLALSFSIPGIDWRAHIGGLIVGSIVAAGFVFAPRGQRMFVQTGVCVLMLALLVGMTAYRTSDLRQEAGLSMSVPGVPISQSDQARS